MNVMFRDEGYTLLETLVGLALFLGVIIPLVGSIGVFMLDKTSDEIPAALRMAQSEMTLAITDDHVSDAVYTIKEGYLVNRTVKRDGRLVEIKIAIHSRRDNQKVILTLVRSLLRDL